MLNLTDVFTLLFPVSHLVLFMYCSGMPRRRVELPNVEGEGTQFISIGSNSSESNSMSGPPSRGEWSSRHPTPDDGGSERFPPPPPPPPPPPSALLRGRRSPQRRPPQRSPPGYSNAGFSTHAYNNREPQRRECDPRNASNFSHRHTSTSPIVPSSNIFLQGYYQAMSTIHQWSGDQISNSHTAATQLALQGMNIHWGGNDHWPSNRHENDTANQARSSTVLRQELNGIPRFKKDCEHEVVVDGVSCRLRDFLPNRASMLLVQNPHLEGKMCRTQAPHSPYECVYIHRAFIQVESDDVHVDELVDGAAVEFLLASQSMVPGKWCNYALEHDPRLCRYLHRHPDSPKVRTASKPQGAQKEQPTADPPHDGNQGAVCVEGEWYTLDRLLRNHAVIYLQNNSSHWGKFCCNMNPHNPYECSYIHRATLPVGNDVIDIGDLLPNAGVQYLLNHPKAIGRPCELSIPHDVSLCSYIHVVPRKGQDHRRKHEDGAMYRGESSFSIGLSDEEYMGHADWQYSGMSDYTVFDSVHCPCCDNQLSPESVKVRGWCETCGVEWQMNRHGHTPRIVLSSSTQVI